MTGHLPLLLRESDICVFNEVENQPPQVKVYSICYSCLYRMAKTDFILSTTMAFLLILLFGMQSSRVSQIFQISYLCTRIIVVADPARCDRAVLAVYSVFHHCENKRITISHSDGLKCVCKPLMIYYVLRVNT